MEISFTEKDIEFRDEIRSWIENDYPSHIKEKQDSVNVKQRAKITTRYTQKGWQ